MDNFCNECGVKVEQNYKFCPNCGSEINRSVFQSSDSSEKRTLEVLICTNCGDENTLESIVCQSCGIKLKNLKPSTKTNLQVEKKSSPTANEKLKIKKQIKSQSKKNRVESSGSKEKKLESKKVFSIVGISLVAILLILIASGIIEISGCDSKELSVNQQNQSSGIDLNALSKINELKSIVEKNPENASAILDLANLRFDSGFFEDAAKNYEQYLNLDPQNADARIDMAVCYYNLQQFDKAESEIISALKYSPKHQVGYLNLGVVYLAKQNVEKAKEWFNKAVELDPNSEIGKKAKSLLQSH